jgi:predicted dehydrogenase
VDSPQFGLNDYSELAAGREQSSMTAERLRIGLIGAGSNMRARHIPGFRGLDNVEIVAVCNRRPSSTLATAREFGISKTFEHWQDLVADPEIDAVVVGTWPYLHCPVAVAALENGKHVLCEARMSLNAAEAHQMRRAARAQPGLVAQLVPSPFGLSGHDIVLEMLDAGFIGELREAQVVHHSNALANPDAPLPWRQDTALSGYNMLTLGILHESLMRWVPPPVRVLAQVHAFIGSRIDPESGARRSVGTPDSVQALAVLENGARASYHLSGVYPFDMGASIRLMGSQGVLHYDLTRDQLTGASHTMPLASDGALPKIPILPEKAREWTVEADFVESIRTGKGVRFTDFDSGVSYMEFTEAVARSASTGHSIDLPLEFQS